MRRRGKLFMAVNPTPVSRNVSFKSSIDGESGSLKKWGDNQRKKKITGNAGGARREERLTV